MTPQFEHLLLIKEIIQNFKDTNPGATRGEIELLRQKLQVFTNEELKLILKGVKK